MRKKSVFFAALAVLTFLTFSCYTQKIVKVNEIKNNRGQILAVVTITGDWLEFPIPGKIVDGNIVYQTIKDGKKTMNSIPLWQVKRVWLKKFKISTKYLLESFIVLPPFCVLAYVFFHNLVH
jgi:hypothetical protein